MKIADERVSGLAGTPVSGSAGKRVSGLNPQTRTHANLLLGLFLVFFFSVLIPASCPLQSAFALGTSETGDQATFTAPLMWRAGGDDSDSFKRVSLSKASLAKDGSVATSGSEGVCELDAPYMTESPMTRLSASWIFTGKVTLEVSVTGNSKDYVRVTNGVPVEFRDRADASRIKWRATLASHSALSQVKIVYADLSGVVGSFGNELLSGFTARKEIQVKGSATEDLFQYPVSIKVGESSKSSDSCDLKLQGGILSDFADVRFTLADGETVAPHFLESVTGKTPDRAATFWVKLPEIPEGGLPIYIYYGKKAADDLSAGEKVFDLFEDFASSTIDPKKWKLTLGDKTGKAHTADSILFLEKAKLTTAQYKFAEGVLEYKARASGNGAAAGILRESASGNNDLVAYASALTGSEHAIAKNGDVEANDPKAVAPGVFYVYRIECDAKGDLVFKRYAETGEGDAQAQVRYASGVSQASPVGLSSSNQDQSVECSWIRTRQHADPAPMIDQEKTAQGLFEAVNLPEFHNISTAPDGTLVTKQNAMEGYYISRLIKPAFAARILKATWETQDPPTPFWGRAEDAGKVNVSISTKEGRGYSEGWENGVTRYVSKKEFEQGGQLRWKVALTHPGKATRTLKRFSLEYYPGTIRVVLPNGSETFAPGASCRIFWEARGFGPKYPVEISYATEGEAEYKMIASKKENSGDFIWTVPNEATEGASVKVADYYDKTIYGVSEDTFTIKPSSGEADEETAPALGTASAPEEGAGSAEQTTQRYLLSGKGVWGKAAAWTGSKVPDLGSEVVLATNATIATDQPIFFRRLVIGDGFGNFTTTVVLKAGIGHGSGEILIRKGGKLIQATSLPQAITGDLVIEDGGALTHKENKGEKEYLLDLTARNIILKAGAIVSARAKGYSGGEERQPGEGHSGGQYKGRAAGGGKHNYDSPRMPTELGSGGAGSGAAKGGAGGGVIKLVAQQEFSLSGIINADGESGAIAGNNTVDAAGGSGGSIYLAANKFTGQDAKVTATGGSGQKTGGAGGGGRIHIKAPSGKISGEINANGGSGQDTGAGSVIVE